MSKEDMIESLFERGIPVTVILLPPTAPGGLLQGVLVRDSRFDQLDAANKAGFLRHAAYILLRDATVNSSLGMEGELEVIEKDLRELLTGVRFLPGPSADGAS